MAGLVPNTKDLEKKIGELNKTLERLVEAQETIVKQNGEIITVLKEIRDKPTQPITNKPFWDQEKLADAISNIRATIPDSVKLGVVTPAYTTPPHERQSSSSADAE